MAAYREVLAGGDAQRGMTIFKTKAALECVRCHKVKETAGDLPVAARSAPSSRRSAPARPGPYLLESIVDPNKQIAQGFESVVLATSDGKVHTGVLRGEDDKEVRLDHRRRQTARRAQGYDRGAQARPLGNARRPGREAIKTELRDLIEFLASLKVPPKTP